MASEWELPVLDKVGDIGGVQMQLASSLSTQSSEEVWP